MGDEIAGTPAGIVAANDPDSIRDLIREYVRVNFLFDGSNLVPDDTTSFTAEGIVDETGFLELALFVEDTWGLMVDPADLLPENFDSVHALAGYVMRRLATAGA
jgi:acyl carrier protein